MQNLTTFLTKIVPVRYENNHWLKRHWLRRRPLGSECSRARGDVISSGVVCGAELRTTLDHPSRQLLRTCCDDLYACRLSNAFKTAVILSGVIDCLDSPVLICVCRVKSLWRNAAEHLFNVTKYEPPQPPLLLLLTVRRTEHTRATLMYWLTRTLQTAWHSPSNSVAMENTLPWKPTSRMLWVAGVFIIAVLTDGKQTRNLAGKLQLSRMYVYRYVQYFRWMACSRAYLCQRFLLWTLQIWSELNILLFLPINCHYRQSAEDFLYYIASVHMLEGVWQPIVSCIYCIRV